MSDFSGVSKGQNGHCHRCLEVSLHKLSRINIFESIDNKCRGIGAGVAVLLAKRGANVVVNYVSSGSEGRAREVADRVRGACSKALLCQASLSNLEEIPKLVKAALEISETGKIEIIVHKSVQPASWEENSS